MVPVPTRHPANRHKLWHHHCRHHRLGLHIVSRCILNNDFSHWVCLIRLGVHDPAEGLCNPSAGHDSRVGLNKADGKLNNSIGRRQSINWQRCTAHRNLRSKFIHNTFKILLCSENKLAYLQAFIISPCNFQLCTGWILNLLTWVVSKHVNLPIKIGRLIHGRDNVDLLYLIDNLFF